MKYKIIYFLTIFSVLLFSCNEDFLDRTPLNGIGEEEFMDTEEEIQQVLTAAYSVLQSRSISQDAPILDGITDNGFTARSNDGYRLIAEGNHNPGSGGAINAKWNTCYNGIYRANYLIKNIGKIELDVDINNRMLGEARFLRAFYYYNLIYFFGDVPLLTGTPTINEVDNVVRTPKSEVLAQMYEDIDFAIANVDESYLAEDYGRVTKAAAVALKTRILLYEKDYVGAATNANAIMSGSYGDFSLFTGDIKEMFLPKNEGNSEVIFEVLFNSDGLGEEAWWDSKFSTDAGTGSSVQPIQDFIDAFETTDGLTIDNPSSIYDSDNPDLNRDPRLDATLLGPGDEFGERGIFPQYRTGASDVFPLSEINYCMRKYLNPANEAPWGPDPCGTNFVLFRYADILLMYAEAKIESNSIDQSVLDAINDVRARAYGTTRDDVPNYPEITTTDQTELRTIVRRERRVEFAYEGLRYLDLIRWDEYKNAQEKLGRNYQGNLWPIPADEIVLSPGLTQNAPWNN